MQSISNCGYSLMSKSIFKIVIDVMHFPKTRQGTLHILVVKNSLELQNEIHSKSILLHNTTACCSYLTGTKDWLDMINWLI